MIAGERSGRSSDSRSPKQLGTLVLPGLGDPIHQSASFPAICSITGFIQAAV